MSEKAKSQVTPKILVIAGLLFVFLVIASILFLNSLFSDGKVKNPTTTATVNNLPVSGAILGTENQVVVEVTASTGNTKKFTINYLAGETAEKLLNRLQKNNSDFKIILKQYDFGAMVEGVNGYTPDINKEFWSFQVNGQDSSVGISAYTVKANDKLGLVITKII